MSVKVTEIKLNAREKTALVSLFADTQSEMSGSPKIDGLPEGYEIESGSDGLTASGEIAFMKSTGQWNWV